MTARGLVAHARLAGIGVVIVLSSRLLTGFIAASPGSDQDARVRVALDAKLPAMRGDRLHATLVEVTYPPGGFSKPHAHSCPLIGHVIDGALHTRVAGGVDTVYRAGQSFREEANEPHIVSANASERAPVTFLVWFLCDGDGPRLIPLADGGAR